uniref:FAM194 C-terminal domain-containing protein n=1 Tax=Leptobrachium leishanense TaxID=445787 RepID=A0A8C5QFJ8_9ANUR
MPLPVSNHKHPDEEKSSRETLQLTVENVIKLEKAFECVDGCTPETRKVEEYIRKTQQSSLNIQSNTETLLGNASCPTVSSTEETEKRDVPADNVSKSTKLKFGVRSAIALKGYTLDAKEHKAENVQTQTEWSWNDLSSQSEIANGEVTFQADLRHSISISLSVDVTDTTVEETSKCSVNEELPKSEEKYHIAPGRHSVTETSSVNTDMSDDALQKPLPDKQLPFTDKDNQLAMAEHQTLCEFCHKDKEAFPTAEQLTSQPVHTLFCCEKRQQLLQYYIMGGSEFNEYDNEAFSQLTQFNEEQENIEKLKEEFYGSQTQDYITSIANYFRTFGFLCAKNTISFTLSAAEKDKDEPYLPNLNLAELFISVPVVGNEQLQRHKELSIERYHSGNNFSILFPDKTGQFFYPSGNVGILITCYDPLQFTFIILEDVEQRPHIQAVFMSNGCASCYHLNGTLWMVIDPLGGSYFDEHGRLKKKWKWWDFSHHVHAPPFQSINLRLNSSTEVNLLAQDQIYVTFSNETKVIFNVGSKLLLRNPERTHLLMKTRLNETERYLRLKRFQIYNLLANIRKSIRTERALHNTTENVEGCVLQLSKSLTCIRRITAKQDSGNISKLLPSKAMDVRDKGLNTKHKQRHSQEVETGLDRTQSPKNSDIYKKMSTDSQKQLSSKSMKNTTQKSNLKTNK